MYISLSLLSSFRAFALLLSISAVLALSAPASGQQAWIFQDFDGDGCNDLVVGLPFDDAEYRGSTLPNAGSVAVYYGDPSGSVHQFTRQVLTQPADPLLLQSGPAAWANFGCSVSWGNFNGDGYADLAVGARGAPVLGVSGAGAVTVFFGGPNGLDEGNAKVLTQNLPQVGEVAESGDWFGHAVHAADLNGDLYTDLAVGAPFEDVDGIDNAGMVHVFYGQQGNALTGSPALTLHQDSLAVSDTNEPWDFFGWCFASGRFRQNGNQGLAIGVPYEDVGNKLDAGAVHVIHLNNAGSGISYSQYLTQDTLGAEDQSEAGDRFGYSLSAGWFHFEGDCMPWSDDELRTDLAVGVPYEDIGGAVDAGAVQLFRGALGGLTTNKDFVLTQSDFPGHTPQYDDRFGFSLSAVSQAWNPFHRLLIGAPGQDSGRLLNVGIVHGWLPVFDGGSCFIDDGQSFYQSDLGPTNPMEAGDQFGFTVGGYSRGNTGAMNSEVWLVGVPFEDVTFLGMTSQDAGCLVFYDPDTQLGETLYQPFSWPSLSEPGSRFGEVTISR